MPFRTPRAVGGAALLVATLLLLAGCVHASEETSIPPLPAVGEGVSPGLGPEAQPLSSGPGYKGSPSWSPRGGRIAFTVDGYVVDSPVGTGDVRRLTTRDFVAEDVVWTSESDLAVLGTASGAGEAGSARSVYRARPGEDSLGVEEVVTEVLAMSPGPEGEGLVVALQARAYQSEVALLRDSGVVERIYTNAVEGLVTGLSLSPEGRSAVLAVQVRGGEAAPFELHVFDLMAGTHRRIAHLEEGLEILGAPQWTERGICYVGGKEATADGGGAEPIYDLYTVRPGSGGAEPTPGVGDDFVASSIRVSPDGERLAIVGRLNQNAPTNLYVLDVAAQVLEDLTVNEDMEIKTGPDDLAWSPSGESVAIVARSAHSEEPSVRAAPKRALIEDFYNLYEVPVEEEAAR